MYRHFLKRFFDFIMALIGTIILFPFFIIIGIIIFIDNPGPIFFKQKRVGKNKKLFWLVKFRTMKTKTPDIPTHLLENPKQYITRFGRIARKLSIDELPQVWMILIGKMSVIGPRPALWNQDDLIAERDKYGANDIKPGLTGWAQINGRDELEIPKKAALDGEYVRKMSFAFDCKCFFGTIAAVFKHEGVVEGGTNTLNKQEQNDDAVQNSDESESSSDAAAIDEAAVTLADDIDEAAVTMDGDAAISIDEDNTIAAIDAEDVLSDVADESTGQVGQTSEDDENHIEARQNESCEETN